MADFYLFQNGLIRQVLSRRNVFSQGETQSYSQIGNFIRAIHSGQDYVTLGPNKVWPIGKIHKRRLVGAQWEGRAFFFYGFGQSVWNAAGVTQASDETESGLTDNDGAYSTTAPLPRKLYVPRGGTFPSPEGAGSPANAYVWPTSVYDTVVPLREAINFLRNSDNDYVYRESAATTALIEFADALPDSSCVVYINMAAGSSSFVDIMGTTGQITGYTWSGGSITYNLFAQSNIQIGQSTINPFTVTGLTPSGANGVGLNVTGVTSSTITCAMAVDPGAYVSGTGLFNNRGVQVQNGRNATATLKPVMEAMGYTVESFAAGISGHESSSTVTTYAGFLFSFDRLRSEVNALRDLTNSGGAVPWIVASQVNWPRLSWKDLFSAIGEASWWSIGWVKAVREGYDTRLATYPIYFAPQGNRSLVGAPHYGSLGSVRWGGKLGNIFVDLAEGSNIVPPGILTATRDANSTTVVTTTTGASIKDTTEVSDPGNSGVQYFTADVDNFTRTLTEKTVTNVAAGATVGVTLSAAPDPRRNYLGVAFKNATQTAVWNGRGVTSATYDDPTDTVTLNLDGPNDLTTGTDLSIFNVFGPGIISGLTVAAGSTGNIVKYVSVTDPTASFTPGGFVINSANYPVGNNYGNRSTLRLETLRHWSLIDGAPLPDNFVQDLIPVTTVASVPGAVAAEAEFRAAMIGNVVPQPKIVFDAADGTCLISGSIQTIVNLGSAGATENMYNGGTSGVTANDFVPSGVYNSFKRDGYMAASASGSALQPVGTPTVGLNFHKANSGVSNNNGKGWGYGAFRFKVGAQAQYIWSTCAGEGATVGPGGHLRIAANSRMQLRTTDAANGTVWSLNSSLTLAADDWVIYAFYFRNGAPSFLWVETQTTSLLSTDNTTTFTSPSAAAAQSALCVGVNSPLAASLRRHASGYQFHIAALSDVSTFDMTIGDLEPYLNWLRKRHISNAY